MALPKISTEVRFKNLISIRVVFLLYYCIINKGNIKDKSVLYNILFAENEKFYL